MDLSSESRDCSVQEVTKYKMQSPFQPGATPTQPGKRTFLCYNMLGYIAITKVEGLSLISVVFHDTQKAPRIPPMIDNTYGFTMASMSENGCVFANMSVVMYQPFKGWATNSEVRGIYHQSSNITDLVWKMRFEEGEEVKVVANGCGWVAAVSSLNILRIYSEGGINKHILSLDGPVVSAVGSKDQLAVVFHVSEVMEFRVFNISRVTEQSKGCVPLTPGSRLTWIGFSEEGALSSYDSEGVLRVFLTSQFGGSWIPMFSSSKEKKQEENYWAVGLNETSFFCMACKYPERYPQGTIPPPIQRFPIPSRFF